MDKRKKLIRIVCMVLVILMGLTLVVPLLFNVYAETPREKMDRLKKELDEIRQGIKATEADKEKTEQKKQYYEQEKNNLAAQIAALNEQIDAQKGSIETKNAEVAEKAANVAYSYEQFRQRLSAMYERSRQSDLAVLLGASSFSEMLLYQENLQQMAVSDTTLVQRLEDEQAALETQRAELQAQLDEMNANQAEMEQKQAEYAESIRRANAAISQAEAELAAQSAAESDKASQYQAAQREWASWTTANNVDMTFGGVFDWPIPGYYTLSSDFGTVRTIYGVTDVHRGMDVPAPAGTPIYAAADGVVSTSNHWSYGVSVKLSHGNGVATIYGHMSARAVNNGETVAKGQLIGYVGSTGNSTGNHLHFEVNVNGQPTSAWPYLKG